MLKTTFAFEFTSVNGPVSDWINTEEQIETYSEIKTLFESVINALVEFGSSDYTAYPFINERGSNHDPDLTINIRDHKTGKDIRTIMDITSDRADGKWNDFRGPGLLLVTS